MRRGLGVLSAMLFLLGVELSTEAISLAVARLRSGVLAVGSGGEFYLSRARFGVGLAVLLLGVALWMLLVWSAWHRRTLRSTGECPRCGAGTQRVRRSALQRWLGEIMEERVTRRCCDGCGWTGLSLSR